MSNNVSEKTKRSAEKQSLKPKLRFPEFRDAGEWRKTFIRDLGEIVTGNTPSTAKPENYGGEYLFVSPADISDQRFIEKTKTTLSEQGFDETRPIKADSILFVCIGSTIGKVAQNKYECATNQQINSVIPSHEHSNGFIYSNLEHNSEKISELAGNHAVPIINKTTFGAFEITVPSLSEQRKIADCLSSLDELITAEAQKLDTLRAYKKGLMQHLFPSEGETVPKLRFPEFLDAGEWEEKRIEDLAKRGSGHTPNKSQPSYYNGGIKWVSLADSNKLDNGYIYETKIEISKDGIENSSAVLHPPGTVIISRDAGVGKSAVLHSAMAVSQHFIVWRCYKSKLSNWFLYYHLQVSKSKFESIATGSTIKTIGLPYFKEIRITIPSVPEQQKIADCLSSLDELIAVQTQKLELLKVHKKGLMQQLFPAASTPDSNEL